MIFLKKAIKNDVKKIVEINTEAFNDEMNRIIGRDGGPPGYDSITEHNRLINNHLVYIINYGAKVIGSFFLVKKGENHFRLESFCILPEYQGRGFGFQTLSLMEKENKHIKKWSLGAFKKSIRVWSLYEKFGYKRIGEDDWEYLYEKLLD